jgi:putative acetyltransferase
MTGLTIRVDDLTHPAVIALLEDHFRTMHSVSPPGSCHVLDVRGLRSPEVTFYSVWDGAALAGVGALKSLGDDHGELKSMRASPGYLGRGVGRLMLDHLLGEARRRGYRRVSLETGSQDYFEPARRLYRKAGFEICAPFADYKFDPHSTFMSLQLA